MSGKPFIVALSGDIYDSDGKPKFAELGLDQFEGQGHIQLGATLENRPEIGPDQISDIQGLILLAPCVTGKTLSQADEFLVISRFGVGYDTVDVEACTQADVVLLITRGAVDRPVAEATVGWMIALSHHMRRKDNLVRNGQWDQRTNFMGCELRDRTLGIIGLGGIGRAVVRLLQGFGMNQPLAFDPIVDPDAAAKLGVRLVELDELMRNADFVSIHCSLNDVTHNLIGARQIEMMKPDAYLLNTARGGIVDEDALYDALKQNRIAGAALDCFIAEPITSPHRFGELDNVMLAPHSIAWTHELFRDMGHTACQGVVELSLGQKPNGVVNHEVFDRESFQDKWARLCT